jgi:glycosyltransferase involved in cell wall biosynthesis
MVLEAGDLGEFGGWRRPGPGWGGPRLWSQPLHYRLYACRGCTAGTGWVPSRRLSQGRSYAVRLLVLSPYPTVPDHVGGKVRIIQLARNLGRGDIEVTILEPYIFGRVFHPPYPENITFRRIKYPFLLQYLLTDRPFPYQFLASFHPGYSFAARYDLQGFDAYQFEHASFADLLDHIPPDKLVIYDAHNIETDYVSAECSNHWARQIVSRRIYKLEKRLVERAVYTLACSEQDRQRLAQLYGVSASRIKVVPNGIRAIAHDVVSVMRLPEYNQQIAHMRRFKRRVLFSGSDVQHNRQAVRFILEVLAPRLSQDNAFIIKGACGTRFRYHKAVNVFFDTQPGGIDLLASISSVAINPVTQGSGTNLKLIDYLAHGLPVVTTEFGMRGYDDLRPYVTVTGLEGFPRELAREHVLSRAALSHLEKYLWHNVADELAGLYTSLTKGAIRADDELLRPGQGHLA